MSVRQSRHERNFVITIHALDRMCERHPELTEGLSDQEIGELIHREVLEAMRAGREANRPPAELEPPIKHWTNEKRARCCWVGDRSRGYLITHGDEIIVLTALKGRQL